MVIVGLLFASWLEEHMRTPAVIAVTLDAGRLVADRRRALRRARRATRTR
jgi:hypothetical protein